MLIRKHSETQIIKALKQVEAGGVGRFERIENRQLIDFWRLTMREKLTNHAFHTRITHAEFHRFFFAHAIRD